ncbi:unnamed protein product [Dovyalis caffra]|uniref:DYW domain-containing protein n=1 Tax=Dovyalis caffra TaxID=77055 RepID=A0AAV1SDZ5_9ROSI|nr:unnamed protein product [Dovyalis caffra]
MDRLAPFYHSPPLLQNHKPKPIRTHSPPSLSLPFTTTLSLETTLTPVPNPSSLNDFTADIKTLDLVKAIHAQVIKKGNEWNSDSMAKHLITSYLQLGDYKSAAMVFFVGFAKNYVMWNNFLEDFKGFGGDPIEVLEVFKELHCEGVMFDSRVISVVLKICAGVMDLWLGLEVHASLIKKGFELDVYVKCALMNFYGKCWGAEIANQVFHEATNLDDLLWNEAILVNLKNGRFVKALELLREMQFSAVKANATTVLKILQSCSKEGALNEGKQIHGYVLKLAMESNLSICNSLIIMYSRNGKIKLASRVFDSMKDHSLSSWNSIISSYTTLGYLRDAWNLFCKMERSGTKPDVITWNSILSGHALHSSYKEVIIILRRMQAAGFRPNPRSITSVLQAVVKLGLLNFGKEIHGYVIRNGLNYDVYVGTSLLDMYVKNECLNRSRAIFDNMKNRNIVAWNSLISGYSFKGHFDEAKRLLNRMKEEGIKPDLITWNSLVAGYSVCGHTKEALALIHDIKILGLTPNVVSWTALVSGCSQNGNYRESFDVFVQMQQEGIEPNSATISTLLRTCGGLSLLQKGKEIHCLSIRKGFIEDEYVATALIDTYSKSGDIESAHEVFKSAEKTLASWNCMIMGFAINGLGREAIALFDGMQGAGILPDAITFTALLSGCKNSGLVEEGWKCFDMMSNDNDIKPTIEHYSCMADLLGRAGYLDEAWDFIQTMPIEPDASVWGAMLGSCRIHGNIEFAEIAAKKLFKLEPYNSANYVLMMSLYAMSNRWEDLDCIKDLMDAKGIKPRQVWSWIQIDQRVHLFSAGGIPHQDEGEIYYELYQLVSELKKFGYVPDINCVYQKIDEVEKEKVLLSHTEKLAIAYGLIKTRSNAPIRVIKNTRICSDCHTAAKYISLVRSREIFLRDGVRFHHFKAGKCSCDDYW